MSMTPTELTYEAGCEDGYQQGYEDGCQHGEDSELASMYKNMARIVVIAFVIFAVWVSVESVFSTIEHIYHFPAGKPGC